jgi:hypothetical protein
MFPDLTLQALNEVVPNPLPNGLRRIVPVSTDSALRFVALEPVEKWDNSIEIHARGAAA